MGDDKIKWVLVADDEPGIRDFVERALNYAGYAVTAANDGKEALEALDKQAYDLLLTDIVMPEIDGIALAEKVSVLWPQTKIMMMTGFANQLQRAYNLDCLSHDVITKPFTMQEIMQKVADTIGTP